MRKNRTITPVRKPGTPTKKLKAISHIFSKARRGKKDREIHNDRTGIEECTKKLEHLYEKAQNATSSTEVSKLLKEILGMTNQVLRVSASSLLLIGSEEEGHYFRVARNKAGKKLSRLTLNLDSGIAAWVISKDRPLIINDVTRDKRFNDEIDQVTGLVTKSVMATPLHRGQKIIGILAAINRVDGQDFDEQDLAELTDLASSEALILLASMAGTVINNITQHQILIDWYKSMFETLITAVDTKDLYASGHSSRVKKYAMMAASFLSLSLEELQAIELGALLHDIGKIWIHDNVLRKAGPLTDKEWYMMRKHAQKGADMLNGIPYLEKVKEIVLLHHERYDGKGYPLGLKGRNIPVGARLVAVADAYDTMTTDHSYRDKMSAEEAIVQLVQGKVTQFCPMVVDAFVSALSKNQEKAEKESGKPAEEEDPAAIEASPDIYQGDVTLSIRSPEGFGELREFKKCLEKTDGLKIALESWSEADGTIIIVSVQKPMALPGILKEMPMVGEVTKDQNRLAVVLKTPTESKVIGKGFSLTWHRPT